ncbi:hypothetical protein OAS82_01025 [Pelagibacteraceae bacterium]|nr:hypothetical protein [Pelagibacteraceae bacterium]
MKKKLIHLFQYKFTNHDYESREYHDLEKKFKIKVLVHDLSKIFFPNFVYIKAKSLKRSKKFKSLKNWLKSLDKLKKTKNAVIVNELGYDSFKSLIIHYYLKKSNLPMFVDTNIGVVSEKDFNMFRINANTILDKFKRILSNNYLLLYFLKTKLLKLFFFFIKFKKVMMLKSGSNSIDLPFRYNEKKIIKVHSRDYSNSLIYNKKKFTKKNKPIIFLDATFPYFLDDEGLYYRRKMKLDLDKYFKEHNDFFDKLEDFFSTKVIITPHPKTRGTPNPFFKKRSIDSRRDATLKLTPSSLLVLCGMYVSTAISFAISSYKPIFFLVSDQMKSNYEKQIKTVNKTSKLIGRSLLDINKFQKEEISNKMTVNKKLYNNYKYRFLTSKKLPKDPNHIIFGKFL